MTFAARTFFGGNSFTSVTRTYTSTSTDTIPIGATFAEIELFGQTGNGAHGNTTLPTQGGGGGSGAYSHGIYLVSGQDLATLSITLGSGGSTAASTVALGTAVIPGFSTLSAPGGSPGTAGTVSLGGNGGAGGTIASGGNVTNSAGNAGSNGDPTPPATGAGGAGVIGVNGTGNPGADGNYTAASTTPGLSAKAIIKYT